MPGATDGNGHQKERYQSRREKAVGLGQLVVLQSRIEIGAVERRSEQGPEHGHPRLTIEPCSDDWKVINGIVAAGDAHFSRVIHEQNGQQDLEEQDIGHASFGESGR